MKVLEFLKEHTLQELIDTFKLDARLYEDRVVLNYNQINSPKHDPVVKECRSLILSLPDFNVLSRSFDRFFNYLEDPEHMQFDIMDAICFQKIDGSIINVYFDGKNWEASTRKMAFAEGETALGHTYRNLFEEALGGKVDDIFSKLKMNDRYTYIFEFVSPETRIVTRYREKDVYLLNVRDKQTGRDVPRSIIKQYALELGVNVKMPAEFRFKTVDDVMESLGELPALDEGYVCYDPYTEKRIKIKNPSYLAVAHLRENGVISTKRVVLLVCLQDHEEYLVSFEEDRSLFEPYIKAYDFMLEYVGELAKKTSHIKDRKEFALAVRGPAQHLMFGIRDGKDFTSLISKMTDNSKERMLVGFKKEMEMEKKKC